MNFFAMALKRDATKVRLLQESKVKLKGDFNCCYQITSPKEEDLLYRFFYTVHTGEDFDE